MPELGWIGWTGGSGVAVLLIGWLVVSFRRPSPRRARIEWIAVSGMYVALLMLFLNLARRAHAADSTLGLVAFGFLVAFFASGLAVCLFHTLSAFRGPPKAAASATN